ncbi:nucleolar protein 7 [Silurus meridionalis]|nr:nucleolar protein 7 [Silurus meridionalis]
MAILQRGKAESKSEKDLGEKMSDLSDDEAPEEVTFIDSKATALKSVKDARDSVKRGKELLKEKRRKRQLLFQEQKKSRLLPETLLKEFETVAQKEPQVAEQKGNQKESKAEKVKKKKKKKGPKRLQGNCKVMRVKDSSADTSMQKSAMDFIKERLYGPGSQRTTRAEQKAKAVKCNERFIHRQKLL